MSARRKPQNRLSDDAIAAHLKTILAGKGPQRVRAALIAIAQYMDDAQVAQTESSHPPPFLQ